MSVSRGGRHAFDAAAVTDARETPMLREGRRERRHGVLVLAASVAALAFGFVADVIPGLTGWHSLITAAIVAGGVFTVQGIRMIREGRATIRDELRRQAESSGSPVDDDRD